MKRGLIMLLLLFSSLVGAEETYYDKQMLTFDMEISNTLNVVPRDSDYSLKKVTVYLSFFPREDFRQSVDYVYTLPAKNEVDDAYKFQWFNPK